LFVTFFDTNSGMLKVRPRRTNEEDTYDEDAEEEGDFAARVMDAMAAYAPPAEKKISVLYRKIPEAKRVPARAILSVKEQARWEACAERFKAAVGTERCDADGLVLTLLVHPRAPDREEHLQRNVKKLADNVGIAAPEAEAKLKADSKFMQFYGVLRVTEKDSKEEVSIGRSLRARVWILTDAFRLAERVSATWEAAREGLEKVRWYRSLLAGVMRDDPEEDGTDGGAVADLGECLDAVAEAWPDVESIAPPAKKKQKQKAKGKGKGKDKGKSRGKGDVKGKGKGKDASKDEGGGAS